MKKGISLTINQIILLVLAIIIGVIIIIYMAPKFSEGGGFLEKLNALIGSLAP